MKKSPSPSNSPSKSAAIDKIIGRLTKAIDQMPLESMVSSVRFPGQSGYSDVNEAEAEATNAIKALSVFAELGRKDAVTALRNIGNLAAKELGFLVTDQNGPTAKGKHIKPLLESPNWSTVNQLPVIKIKGNLSPIADILKSEASAIKMLSKEDILAKFDDPYIAGGRQWVVNCLSALGISGGGLEESRRQSSKENPCHDHPLSILEMLYTEVERNGLPQKYKREECARIAVYELIAHLLEERLTKSSKAGLEELPSKSFEWPLCTSAFSSDIAERYQSLKLGHSLRFVPRVTGDKGAVAKQNPKGGNRRRINPGEPAHFALEYCIALDDARRLHIHSSDSEKTDWAKTIQKIEKAIEEGVEGDPKRKLADPLINPNRKLPSYSISLSILWTYKAALLPEFPYPHRGGDDVTKKDLELWIDAALARARMMCGNDWEFYRDWPKCVDARSSQKESAYTAVKEKLKEGMGRLELAKTTAP